MKKRIVILFICCALILSLGLAGCGSSGGPGTEGPAQAAEPEAQQTAEAEAAAKAEEEAAAKAAEEAQFALEEGLGYWFGTGENGFDKEQARAAIQKAADLGNADGWYWLGVLRQHDVEADRWQQVIEYYQKAADNGCARGLCGLGRLYESGYGFEVDITKATALYQQAIDAGELYGSVCLGFLYEKGKGVDVSGVKAAELYEKAAASEDFATRITARVTLGSLYNRGTEDLESSPEKAREYYQLAADENYYAGWHGLGNLYAGSETIHDQGVGFEPDPAKKFEYDSREAALGTVYALAQCYRDATGCEADFAKAIEL